jgi:hypothetical protein
VPTAQATPAGTSSTWIGIDGFSNTHLIQAGTEQDTWEGFPDYYAWYELLPNSEIEIGAVSPGDHMSANIFKNATPANTWTIDISDLSVSGDNFSQIFSYTTPETSAEWIEEMTSISPKQPPLANFGTATFTAPSYTTSDPSNNVPTLIDMENNAGNVLAYPTGSDSTEITAHYGPPPTNTSVTASPSPVGLGGSVNYSASVTTDVTGMPTPTGSVVFSTGSTVLCTASLSSGSGTCSSSAAPAGTDTITGTYQGDKVFSKSTGTTTVVVNPPSTQTTITASPNPVETGTSVTYSATVTSGGGTPTGSVAFSTGSTSLCTATLSNGSGHCSSSAAPVGTDTISGQYQGTGFAGSTGTTSLTVNPPPSTQTTITASPNPVETGTSVTYSVTVTSGGGTPTGSVTFSTGSTSLCTTTLSNGAGTCSSNAAPVGTDTISGQYQGTGFAGSTGTTSLTVNPPPSTQTTITASPNPVETGASVTYSATVTSGGGTPTGSVAFSTGSTSLCTATLSNGSGQCSSTAAPLGPDAISGHYQGTLFAASTGTTSLTVNAPPPPPSAAPAQHGYWLVGSDGGIFTFGSAQFYGSTGSLHLQRPVVGIVPTTDRNGYWLDASDGGIFAFGDAGFHGSIPGLGLNPAGSGLPNSLNAPIVGMVPSADGGGYFMVASDGGVFAFGDAHFAGSCPGIGGCTGAAVAVMPDASGNGYWLVTQSGHVYTFGDAPYYGAPGPQGAPVTSAVRTPDGHGYWILFANGAISNYGDAGNFGSPAGQMGGLDPASAIYTTSDGGGYWVAAANGAVANYGDAPNDGSMAGTQLNGSIIAATGW